MIKKCLKAFYVGLILLLLYAPILLLAVYSFNEVDTLGPMGEFSLKHYAKLFGDPAILEMIGNTVVLALVAAALSTVLGTAGAIGMFYSKRRTRAIMNGVNQIPVINARSSRLWRLPSPSSPSASGRATSPSSSGIWCSAPLRGALRAAQIEADGPQPV